MDTVIRNVGDMEPQDRQALEHVLGLRLLVNQQLLVRVVDLETEPGVAEEGANSKDANPSLPAWCNVYAGLSDAKIADLEKTILSRADLTRHSEQRMDAALLDTDTLNEVLKGRNPTVVRHAADYLQQHGQFAISSITWYEVLRGLLEKNAAVQLAQFRTFCGNTLLLPVTIDELERAAHLWAVGRSQGLAPKDADLVIGATAIVNGRTLVTGNTAHFTWIPGLTLANWRNP